MGSDLSQVTQPVDGRTEPPTWICCLPTPRSFSSSILIWEEMKTPENRRGATLQCEESVIGSRSFFRAFGPANFLVDILWWERQPAAARTPLTHQFFGSHISFSN